MESLTEAAIVRWAALKQIWPLQQHWKDLEGTTTIHTLVAVLMHVEDVEEKVAEAAKDTLRHLAEALRWHLGGTLLARGTYSLQELLHQIAKRLIRFPMSEGQLELEVLTCLSYCKSKQASVRRTAAMFIGHLLHQNGSLLTGGTVPIYLAYMDRLLGDQDPAVRRVAYVTKVLRSTVCHVQVQKVAIGDASPVAKGTSQACLYSCHLGHVPRKTVYKNQGLDLGPDRDNLLADMLAAD
ncbi:maestro heat-like repeat-containing protein family member 6 [Liasis olivaceus]